MASEKTEKFLEGRGNPRREPAFFKKKIPAAGSREAGRSREPKKLRVQITYRGILKYTLYAALFLILSRAEIAPGIRPFAFGFFYALLFAGQNMLVLSALYILCAFAAPGDGSLIAASVSAGVTLIAQSAHIFFKKRVTLPLLLLYAGLGQAGYAVLTVLRTGNYLIPALTVIFGLIFLYACASVLHSVLVRGLKYKLNASELACAGTLLLAVSMGLTALTVYAAEPVRAAAAFLILFCVYCCPEGGYALGVGLVMGIGAGIQAGDMAYAGGFALAALLALIFAGAPRVAGAAALVIGDLLFGLYFRAFGGYGWGAPLSAAVGAIAFLAVPKSVLRNAAGAVFGFTDKFAARAIVNKHRQDLSRRLLNIAGVFSEMGNVFSGMVKGVMPVQEAKTVLAAEAADRYCADCGNFNSCHGNLKEETLRAFADCVEAGVLKGRVTVLDLPPFVVSRCRRMAGLIAALQERAEAFVRYAGAAGERDGGRAAAGQQLAGAAGIVEAIAKDCGGAVSFDPAAEKRVMEELTYRDVVCCESVMYAEQGGAVPAASLIVRADTFDGSKIERAVSKACGCRMAVVGYGQSPRAGWNAVNLRAAPRYDVVFGSANAAKAENRVSGDTHSFVKIGDDKFMMALCDGMGSGEKARAVAELAVSLTENLYKAGFDSGLILNNVNRLVSLGCEDNFTALDICVMDLREGAADFIKIGAPIGALKHKNDAEALPAGSLPLGVLDEMKPCVSRRPLTGGDMVVLTSDGVTDVFASQADYLNLINNIRTANPQTLAGDVLKFCVKRDKDAPHDDMTVLAARIYAPV
ncbi:MAG: SpoIIE family protein phosphatase [Clostridiales bacterium]|jgi:stage II sporulation protein E|nr:SpoIIE family protein phosphatase [Clostridiales bacterium]